MIRLLSIVLTLSVLAACGGKTNSSSSSSLTSQSLSVSSRSSASTVSSTSSLSSAISLSSASASAISSASGSSIPAAQARCEQTLADKNRDAATAALNGLFVRKDTAAINQYWADPYLQHNPIAQSGVATFRSIMGSVVGSASFKYELLGTLAECDLAIVIGRYNSTGLIMDMFRLKDGKIIEHWDSDGNQASPFSGFKVQQTEKNTHENREWVTELFNLALIPNIKTLVNNYFSTTAVIDGQTTAGGAGFIKHLDANKITYKKIHHVIADGDYVFILSEGTLNNRAYGIYDVFRLNGDKIVNHWHSKRVVPSSTASGLGIF